MSGCGCKQNLGAGFAAASAGDADDNALLQALRNQFGAAAGAEPGLLSAQQLEAGLGQVAAAELAQIAAEDRQFAQDELQAVLDEDESGEATLDELLEIVRNRPGLKISFSY